MTFKTTLLKKLNGRYYNMRKFVEKNKNGIFFLFFVTKTEFFNDFFIKPFK
jgi:hypothetical protein